MLPITNSLDDISLSLMKGFITIDLIEKATVAKNNSNYQFLRQYFPFFIERTHHYWFQWKRGNCNEWFQLPIPQTIFHFFYWKHSSLLISVKRGQLKRMLPITNSLDDISLSLMKGFITIYFIEKAAAAKNNSNYQFLRQYFIFFIERTHHYWFQWKWGNYKECFQLPIQETIFHYVYWKDSSLLISLEKVQL